MARPSGEKCGLAAKHAKYASVQFKIYKFAPLALFAAIRHRAIYLTHELRWLEITPAVAFTLPVDTGNKQTKQQASH